MADRPSPVTRYLIRAAIAIAAASAAILVASAIAARASIRSYTFTFAPASDGQTELLPAAAARVRQRMEALARDFGVRRWSVETSAPARLILRIDAGAPPDELAFWATMQGRAAFHLLHPEAEGPVEAHEGETPPDGYMFVTYRQQLYSLSRPGELNTHERQYMLRREPVMRVSRFSGVEFATAGIHRETVLTFRFLPEEAEQFREVTALNAGRHMAMLVDGRLFIPPKQIEGAVEGGVVQARGYFYNPPLRKLARALHAGPLPCELKEVSRTVEK
jgi:preprotein translocase subunit SecD